MNNYTKIILKRIDSIFKNGGENWSSQRILSIICVVIPVIVWCIVSLKTMNMAPMSYEILSLIAIGMTGKVISKKMEK